ncbi:MAG: pyridoxal-phosphate dependent enzyme, partial [Acidilobaceae archaeon]
EPEAAPKMLKSINAGKPIEVDIKPSIADGLITKRPGDLTYTITSNLVDDIITVDEEELSQAIYFMLERKKTLVEGAGAASIAPIISGKIKLNGLKVVSLSTGGNIDLTALNRIIIRGLSKLGRIARIAGYVPDYPGQLKRVLEVIASHRGNILDILHDRSDPRVPPWHAKVIILFEAPTNKTVEDIVSELKSEGYYFIIEI